ncbi:serine protease inhibitor dipetalogastin-like [Periplaneta americana]|uniref:serine protease inhibitor dipetalogastin-like n=1 Tax=Periplaneta americana TaxID=6978 RepID=UPI0037E9A08B
MWSSRIGSQRMVFGRLRATMLLTTVLIFLAGISSTTSHWRIKGEYVCLEAAKNVTYDPLCASNGQTYQNYITFQCFIRYFNVHGLTVRRGACFRNPEPDHCVLSFVVWRRVCGTDNVTYSSVWELLCEARRQNKGNAVQYEGPCRIQCPMSLVYKPVCSSESVVYPNLDALRCTAMREPEKNITKKKDGVCGNSQALSICLPSKYSGGRKRQTPVCASNGVTYASYNALACLRLYNRGNKHKRKTPNRPKIRGRRSPIRKNTRRTTVNAPTTLYTKQNRRSINEHGKNTADDKQTRNPHLN